MKRVIPAIARLAVVVFCLGLFVISSHAQAEDRLTVYTVNYPLAYFTERVGGNQVKVVFPAPADVDPAYWSPETQTVIEFQKADLIIINGADYAKWLTKVSLPKSRIVNTTKDISDRYIPLEQSLTHNHGPSGAHSHEGVAFTVWLDLDIAVHQAEKIAAALGRKIPGQKSYFQNNLDVLKKELLSIDKRLLALGKLYSAFPLLGSHPVYHYFKARYGFNLTSVHWEPDQQPTGQQIAELKEILKQHQATIMIWEGEPEESTRKTLEELGLQSVVFDPCGNHPGEGNFLDVLKKNTAHIEKVLTSK